MTVFDRSHSLELNNGVTIPQLGLGVWQAQSGEETYQAVRSALELGYRHIDTARIYGNEADVGRAVRDSGLPRDQIFVTTKLWKADQGYDKALKAFDASLERLGIGHIDLYLIHWPVTETRQESWRALETIAKSGRCRAIGVSNYTERHLEAMRSYASIQPAVNQVELHPFLYQKSLLDHCAKHSIVVEAYSPLTHGKRLNDPTLGDVAEQYRKTPAQILIRWAIQHDTVVLPKSTNPHRIKENAEVYDFEISSADMQRLDALNENLRTCWDPSQLP